MATDLYVNTTSHALLASAINLTPLSRLSFYFGDTIPINLNFYKETGLNSPILSAVDLKDVPITLSIGSVGTGPLVSTSLWSDNPPVTASLLSVTAGSSSTNAVQSLIFNQVPKSGSFSLTMPGTTGSFTTSAKATVFTTSGNHGLVVGQTIALSWSAFEIPAFSTSVPYSGTFYVNSTPTSSTFTVASSPGGSNISPAASLGIFSDATTGQTATVIGLAANTFATSGNHRFVVGDSISFSQSGIFNGITQGTTYYVQAVPSSTSFTLSATSGGEVITGISFSSFTGSYSTPSQTTASIPATASASAIQTAVSGLSGIGQGNVLVSGTSPAFSINFVNALARFPVSLLQLVSNFGSSPYKSGAITLTGSGLLSLLSNSTEPVVMEISSSVNGLTQTLAHYPVTILPSLSQGGTSQSGLTDLTYITQPIILGADYAFGVLPTNQPDGSYLDLTGCFLTAQLYDAAGGNLVENLNVTMPSGLGNPILCKLPAASTGAISLVAATTWWLKLLLQRADGSILSLGNGPVQVQP
jgi:hypothetical protein